MFVEEYNLHSALSNATKGLDFGQLLRGDVMQAKRQLERLLSPCGQKVAVEKQGCPPIEAKCLELVKLEI